MLTSKKQILQKTYNTIDYILTPLKLFTKTFMDEWPSGYDLHQSILDIVRLSSIPSRAKYFYTPF